MLEDRHFTEVRECDLCGKASFKLIFTVKDGFEIMKCDYCALCFTSPRLLPKDLTEEYAKEHDDIFVSKTYLENYIVPVENQKEEVVF